MVLQIDLSQDKKQSLEKTDYTNGTNITESTDKIHKRSFTTRIQNKFKIWKANLAKIPLSHKITLTTLVITLTGLVSIAIVYSFIIFTAPEHQILDTSYTLLEMQNINNTPFLHDLPIPPVVKDRENPINGELYTKEDFDNLIERGKPIAVIIENYTKARPQAGLYDADLVYETLAESGITRFMAIFWGKSAEKVGPVRSLRTYFLDWAAEYNDPPICNIGQAGYETWEEVIVPEADARRYIQTYDIKSFDWYGRNVTWRDTEKYKSGIGWEHVAYSSTETLWKDAEELEWNKEFDIPSLTFKKDASKQKRPLAQEIEIRFLNLSSEHYRVKWSYSKDNNIYKRYLAGIPHIDENNNKQIMAKNIIIQHCKYQPTGDRNGRIVFTTIGEGRAQVIQDGKVIEGVWKKSSRTDRTKFFDNNSQEIALNRGQIWIEIVPVSGITELSTITIR